MERLCGGSVEGCNVESGEGKRKGVSAREPQGDAAQDAEN